jgi:mono/diheme cytochrome c family protein
MKRHVLTNLEAIDFEVYTMLELLQPSIPIATASLLIWSGFRAWRTENRFLKWGGSGLAAVLATVVGLIGVVLMLGLFKLHARTAPLVTMTIAGTPEQIRRGQEISDSFCSGCHSKTGPLTGGNDVGQDLPVRIGSFVSANLTPAGPLSRWSDGEIFRAIRNGIDHNGRWLIIMSYTNASKLSDDDTQAVIAYLRHLPAAGRQTANPPDHLNLLGLLMLGAGMLPTAKSISHGIVTAPPKAPTAQYGEYILSYQDCRECHGKNLTGGVPGQLPPLGPDLNLVKDWKFEEFVATMRTGVDPNGHEIGEQMPWRSIGRMSDEELRAIYEYLTRMPKA